MNRLLMCSVVGLAAVALSACAGTRLQEAKNTQSQGSGFTADLAKGYVVESQSEYSQGDYRDSDRWAKASMAAAKGQTVQPTQVSDWRIPRDKTGELTQARTRLVTALNNGAATKAPADAAKAQVNLDCWMEQQEENFQPNDIAACRNGFYEAMNRVDAAMAGPTTAAAPAKAPSDYLVFFDWNKANLTPEARQIVATAAADFKKMGAGGVTSIGYTDRSGSDAYNLKLSVRRAEAVKQELIRQGIPTDAIRTVGKGEADPLVPTADGVREPQNRRVQIVPQKAGM